MKKIFYIIILLLGVNLSINSFGQFKMMGSYDTVCCGLPNYLVAPDTLTSCFLSRVHASLPEGISVPCYEPSYLYSTAPTVLHLESDGDVWLTYVGQGNWYENVLGFYTFPWGTPPTSIADSMVTVVFPNATLWGTGGALNVGSRVYLGHFPANTGFGFMLIGNGWRSAPPVAWRSDSFLAEGKNIYYSHANLNPVSQSDNNRHVVGLYDNLSNLIVMGFEDQNRGGLYQPDNDFNDVLFYLKTNGANGFDTTGFPNTLITCDSSVGTGSGGGLESQNLGGKVSKRDFDNLKKGIVIKPDYSPSNRYRPGKTAERTNGTSSSLERFMPVQLYVSTSPTKPSNDTTVALPYYSTPTDITSLTFAKDVLAVDYVANDQAKAVVLGITTLDKAYNHTKSICDRFRGATLQKTDTIRIQGYRFVIFSMLQTDGTVEYSITFDVGKSNSGGNFYLQSKWLISQYKGYDSVFNFQVWASNPGSTIKLTSQILNQLQAISPLQQVDTNFVLPQVYITNGKRNKGSLDITVANYTTATTAQIMLEENKNELAPLDTLYYNISLTNGVGNTLSIPINDGYQYEGHVYVNGVLLDDVYMADGNWSLDYDHSSTIINDYVPGNESGRTYIDGEYPVYRSVAVKAAISEYMNAYKYLTSGDEKVDLSNYHSFKFHAQGTGQMLIKLVKAGITSLDNQYHTSVALDPAGKDYQISFNDFYSDAYTADFDPKDVTAVVFSFNFYSVPTNMNFFAGGLSFSQQDVYS